MPSSDRVTIKDYGTTDDAKAAEALLHESGISAQSISRTGKKIRVDVEYESQARAVLAGMAGSAGQPAGATAADRLADAAHEAASSVVDTAQGAVGAVADTVQDVTGAVTSRIDKVSETAADQVETLADTVWQGATREDAPALQRRAAETTTNVLDKVAEYLRDGDAQVILEDVRGAIRRHPGRSLLLGLSLGYLARGRFFGARMQGIRQPGPRAVPVYGLEAAASGPHPTGSFAEYSTAMETIGTTDADELLYGLDAGAPTDENAVVTRTTDELTSTVSGIDAAGIDPADQRSSSAALGMGGASTMPTDEQLRQWEQGARDPNS